MRESRRLIRAARERPGGAVRTAAGRGRGRRRRAAGAGDRLEPADAARPAPARGAGAARRQPDRSRSCSAGSSSTSSTSTIRSRPAPPRRRCATRARSTSAASTSRPSASSRPRWRGRWSRSSSAASTPAPPAAAPPRTLMERFFPGTYELVEPGADADVEPWWPRAGADGAERPRPRIAFCVEEERGALRLVPPSAAPPAAGRRWEAAVWVAGPTEIRIARRLRDRVRSVGPREASPEAADRGSRRRSAPPRAARGRLPGLVRKALASGDGPGRARSLSLYEELTGDGRARPAVPARGRDHPGRPARAADRRASACARELRGGPRRGPRLGARSPTSSRRSTGGSAPAATTPRQPRAAPAGRPAARRSTSTSTCTRTTRRTARRRSRCCWRRRATAGLGRDRDHRPQRDLGRARRRARSPRRSGSR